MGQSRLPDEVGVRAVRLTKREVEVLGYLAVGQSSKDVAGHLVLSKRTIDFHVANVFSKLNVTNRIQALNAARQMGFLTSQPLLDGGDGLLATAREGARDRSNVHRGHVESNSYAEHETQ